MSENKLKIFKKINYNNINNKIKESLEYYCKRNESTQNEKEIVFFLIIFYSVQLVIDGKIFLKFHLI